MGVSACDTSETCKTFETPHRASDSKGMVTRYERAKVEHPPVGEPSSCGCGCGQPTHWNPMKAAWRRFLSGHNARVGANGNPYWKLRVDWADPRWVYLLAAHLGDGCDHRRLDIAVGNDSGWERSLMGLMRSVGLSPSVGESMRVRASSVPVMRELARFKPGGRSGRWEFPFLPTPIPVFLAGLLDSDGGVYPGGGVIIHQRDNGNLERLEALLRATGETRLHLGRDERCGVTVIKGREIQLGVAVRLGLRGTLREEVMAHSINPIRLGQWAVYRAKHWRKPGRPSKVG